MKYEVTDSHRKMSKRTKKVLTDFFCEVKGIPRDAAEGQTAFCDWYEKEYAVKWFEVTAWEDGAVVGYLRCMRDPDDVRRWYVGDVHVRAAFYRKGVATAMYELMIQTLQEFGGAEKLVSAIKRNNARSIGLHKKFGFHDTGEPCVFADFYVCEDETKYERWLYQIYPVPNVEGAVDRMLPHYSEWRKQSGKAKKSDDRTALCKLLSRVEKGAARFESIWCGNRLVGFRMDDGNGEVVFNTQEPGIGGMA
ncbi:MAG: GNAT family N-acetyltransferase [Lachnospiraceae bacterium]|nr:GNAT family N-acetyltransferase [Lachnospiraceae bacterium]